MQSCKWFLSLLGSLLLIQQTCAAEVINTGSVQPQQLSVIGIIEVSTGTQTSSEPGVLTETEVAFNNQINDINNSQPDVPNNSACPVGIYVCAEAYEGELSPVQRVLQLYGEVAQIN